MERLTINEIKEMSTPTLETWYRMMILAKMDDGNFAKRDAMSMGLMIEVYGYLEVTELGNCVLDQLYSRAKRTIRELDEEIKAEARKNRQWRHLVEEMMKHPKSIKIARLYHELMSS